MAGGTLMMKSRGFQPWFGRLVGLLSGIHVLLALNFFPLVPFLGWLNFGRGEWIAWIPDIILRQVLPAGYYVYWHFWFLISLPAVAGSWYLCHQTQGERGCWLLPANLIGLAVFTVVRLTLFFLEIRPDIV